MPEAGRVRRAIVLLALALVPALVPAAARAQQPPTPPALPTQQDAAKALKALQDQLEWARKERLALEAKLEKQLAEEIAQRAKALAMSGEVGALQRLETLLDSAQARLLVQRDRIRQLQDATGRTEHAVLVVLMRVDSLPAGEMAAVLLLDGAEMKVASYTPQQARSLAAGAAAELYRAEIAPVNHTVFLQVAGKGFSVGEGIAVPAAPKTVTYVEFVLRRGRLVPSTWTNKPAAF